MHIVDAFVANQVRQIRIDEGLPEIVAAVCLGVSMNDYASKEAGCAAFRPEELKSLADILGVSTALFFEGVPQPI